MKKSLDTSKRRIVERLLRIVNDTYGNINLPSLGTFTLNSNGIAYEKDALMLTLNKDTEKVQGLTKDYKFTNFSKSFDKSSCVKYTIDGDSIYEVNKVYTDSVKDCLKSKDCIGLTYHTGKTCEDLFVENQLKENEKRVIKTKKIIDMQRQAEPFIHELTDDE